MTDAELSRQEWIDERIAIMVESGMPEFAATELALSLWNAANPKQMLSRCAECPGQGVDWNAPASHGDGAGACGGENSARSTSDA